MTLTAVALLAVLFIATVVGAALAGLVAVQHRAAAAADLAALAGARRPESGCSVARQVAVDNGARLVECSTSGDVVTVDVQIRAPGVLQLAPTITARARAGPAPVARHREVRTRPE